MKASAPAPYVELRPIFDDNYLFVAVNPATQECLIVDPGDLGELPARIEKEHWLPRAALITHHHGDHIGGLEKAFALWSLQVFAPLANQNQIPCVTTWVQDQQHIHVGSFSFQVLALPGHTLGHVAYYNAENGWLFSGDVLFGLGCGRLFEGSYEQAFHSLQIIKALPPTTRIFCAHEYTEANLKFCQSLGLNSPALLSYESRLREQRQNGHPSVPLLLQEELDSNPFLLAQDVSEFARLRELRNKF